jgi:hypothetical protein
MKMIGIEALGNGNDHFGIHESNDFCRQRGCYEYAVRILDPITLPSGRVLIVGTRPRPGFDVPEAFLVGEYDSIDSFNDAISEGLAS